MTDKLQPDLAQCPIRPRRVFLRALGVLVLAAAVTITIVMSLSDSGAMKGLMLAVCESLHLPTRFVFSHNFWIRKVGHFAAYALIGFVLLRLWPRRVVLVCSAVAGLSIAMEIAQCFVPGRGPSVRDALLGIGGMAVALVLARPRAARAGRCGPADTAAEPPRRAHGPNESTNQAAREPAASTNQG